MDSPHFECPHCDTQYTIIADDSMRLAAVILVGTNAAAHLRYVHNDGDRAFGVERKALVDAGLVSPDELLQHR